MSFINKELATWMTGGTENPNHLQEALINITFIQKWDYDFINPWNVYVTANEIFKCISSAIEFLKMDTAVPETPVLSGLVTPEMVVELEIDNKELPPDIDYIYTSFINNSTNIVDRIMDGSFNLQDQDSNGKCKNVTIH